MRGLEHNRLFLFLRTIIMHSYEKILFNYERSNYYV
nr:MAG TPA: hypothetical protein [Caudoviricetes sp.]